MKPIFVVLFISAVICALAAMSQDYTATASLGAARAPASDNDSTMEIKMHASKGPKKKVRPMALRDRTDLPQFDDPFAPSIENASRQNARSEGRAAPRPAPVAQSYQPYPEQSAPAPVRESSASASTSSSASAAALTRTLDARSTSHFASPPRIKTEISSAQKIHAMGWLDYSALGVLTSQNTRTSQGVSQTTPQSNLLEQTLTLGGGVDISNNLHLSLSSRLQYANSAYTNENATGSANTSTMTPAATGAYVEDIYAHAISKIDASEWLGAGETFKLDAGALAPFASDAKSEGYQSVYLGSMMLASRLIPKLLTLQNTVSGNYIWNQYEYSTVDGMAHQQGGLAYRLGTSWRLMQDLEFTLSAGAKLARYFDGTQATHFNGSANMSYRIENWLLRLSYSGGSYQEQLEQNLWFIDKPQQVIMGGLGFRF